MSSSKPNTPFLAQYGDLLYRSTLHEAGPPGLKLLRQIPHASLKVKVTVEWTLNKDMSICTILQHAYGVTQVRRAYSREPPRTCKDGGWISEFSEVFTEVLEQSAVWERAYLKQKQWMVEGA